MMRPSRLVPLVSCVAVVLLAACSSGDTTEGSGASESVASTSAASASSAASEAASEAAAVPALDGPVTIGAFGFTESQIMAELYAGVLGAAGIETEIVQSTNREVLEPALEAGEVEVVPEYLGTFTEFLNLKVNGPDAEPAASNDTAATLAAGRALAEPLGITLLTPSAAQDANAFAVTRAFAEENGIATLSDLAAWSQENDLTLAGPPECPERPFCQPGLEEVYGVTVAEFTPLDAGGPLTKSAIDQGSADVGLVFSSDGSVADLDFVVLADDKGLQNVENLTPALLTSVAAPEVVAALDELSAALTTADLIEMNKAVDLDRLDAMTVAREWLAAKGLG